MMVGNSALYRYKEGKPGRRRYDKAGNDQGLNGGGGGIKAQEADKGKC